jgi:hypothetical protein
MKGREQEASRSIVQMLMMAIFVRNGLMHSSNKDDNQSTWNSTYSSSPNKKITRGEG